MLQFLQNNYPAYQINDIIPPSVKYLFILESPHIHEIKYQYPLTGPSGNRLAMCLGIYNKSFGEFASSTPQAQIGIMNISQFPLQSKPYTDNNIQINNALQSLLNIRKIKKSFIKNPNKEHFPTETEILFNFGLRLRSVLESNPKIETIFMRKICGILRIFIRFIFSNVIHICSTSLMASAPKHNISS